MKKKWKVVLSTLLTGTVLMSAAACSGGNEDLVAEKGGGSKGDKQKLVFLRA